MSGLLTEIIHFCDRHRIGHATFGRNATNDPILVQTLINGRSAGNKVQARIRDYMRAVDAGERPASVPAPLRPRKAPASPPPPRVSNAEMLHEAMRLIVDRDPCFRCGVRKDRHDDAGCGRWR